MKRFFVTPLILLASLLLGQAGCVKSRADRQSAPFVQEELDACLAIAIDTSGSFSDYWDDRAYQLFIDLSESFFSETMGNDTRLIISQLSGSDEVILFEGRPNELQKQFPSPESLSEFLQSKSDPSQSRVFDGTTATINHLQSLSGITSRTQMLTVILSDMQDSEPDVGKRRQRGAVMVDALKRYRESGGGLALYYVATEDTERWGKILEMAGFESGHYIIANELSLSPQLPTFD